MELPDIETDIYGDEVTLSFPDITTSINSTFLPNYGDERGEFSAFEMFIVSFSCLLYPSSDLFILHLFSVVVKEKAITIFLII